MNTFYPTLPHIHPHYRAKRTVCLVAILKNHISVLGKIGILVDAGATVTRATALLVEFGDYIDQRKMNQRKLIGLKNSADGQKRPLVGTDNVG